MKDPSVIMRLLQYTIISLFFFRDCKHSLSFFILCLFRESRQCNRSNSCPRIKDEGSGYKCGVRLTKTYIPTPAAVSRRGRRSCVGRVVIMGVESSVDVAVMQLVSLCAAARASVSVSVTHHVIRGTTLS